MYTLFFLSQVKFTIYEKNLYDSASKPPGCFQRDVRIIQFHF